LPIRQRSNGFQVEVNDASALPKFRRIRTQCEGTREDAMALEASIRECLKTYKKWPLAEGDQPVQDHRAGRKVGTLRIAAQLALDTHWVGMAYEVTTKKVVWPIVRFFEDVRGVYDIDDITSEDLDAFVADCRSRGNTSSTINKNLSNLSVINTVALERKPPLTATKLPIKRQRVSPTEKWWLRPEDMERATRWLREERGDPIFADFIEIIVKQGLRVEEALRLEPRHFTGLDTEEPWLHVPGTKTKQSGDSIPVYPWAVEVLKRSLQRAKVQRLERLYPYTTRQASDRWNEVRAFLGASHINTATLRALRRTFAYYANTVYKMPTRTLQRVLRHNNITTTEGYLQLLGTDEVARSREYFTVEAPRRDGKSALAETIEAYRQSGATPEEVARFVKEIMR
jgi:integrase